MSKGYAIVTERIKDREALDAYSKKAAATVMQYGGKPLVFSDDAEVIEGIWHGDRTLVIEFDSVDDARTWYESAEYQAIVGERHAAAESHFAIVPGL